MRRLAGIGLGVLVAVSGCGLSGRGNGDEPAAAAARPSAVSGLGSVKDSGNIPDPCTLLSRVEVVRLTGRTITQVDEDGGQPGDSTRYCQWQQENGQLALFLSRTTSDDFRATIEGATPVDGVGEDAYELAGHLYVLYGTVQLDVYSRGATDQQNLTDAEEVVDTVIPRI